MDSNDAPSYFQTLVGMLQEFPQLTSRFPRKRCWAAIIASSLCIRSQQSTGCKLGHQHFLGKEKAGGSSPPVGSQFNSTASARGFVSQRGVAGPATGTTFIGVGETVSRDQSVRRVASCLSHGSGP